MPHRLPDVSIKFPKLPSVDGENVVFRLIKAHLFSKKTPLEILGIFSTRI
jgi:hypothetical protein